VFFLCVRGNYEENNKERYPRYPRSGRRQESDSYDAVPMLRYGANCNLPIFKQKLVAEAMVRYGDLAKVRDEMRKTVR